MPATYWNLSVLCIMISIFKPSFRWMFTPVTDNWNKIDETVGKLGTSLVFIWCKLIVHREVCGFNHGVAYFRDHMGSFNVIFEMLRYFIMSLWHGNCLHYLPRCDGNPPVTGGFPSQRVSNVEFSCLLLCLSQQAVKQTFDWTVFYKDMVPKWLH